MPSDRNILLHNIMKNWQAMASADGSQARPYSEVILSKICVAFFEMAYSRESSRRAYWLSAVLNKIFFFAIFHCWS